jgi:hypothetical protein
MTKFVKNPKYALTIWQKCRDVIEGQEAIHLSTTKYLPRLSGMTTAEYNAYLSRTTFYNATQRTVDAMSGLLFRKEPVTIKMSAALTELCKDIDLQGNTLQSFVEQIADEVMSVGRIGVLVDYPTVELAEGTEITVAQAEQSNLRPFIASYKAEDIWDWKTGSVNNKKVLIKLVLHEVAEEADPSDEFKTKYVDKVRVLDLVEGIYRQRIYKLNNKEYVFEKETLPTINSATLDYIPFVFFNPKNNEADVAKPPLLDLVNVNISHYKTTGDLEHGAHFVGLPTAVITGHRLLKDEVLKIGSSTAWVFAEPEAKASYLEFTGQGLDALEKRLTKKEEQMATLGARMLATEKAAAESAEAHSIKRQGENSVLGRISNSISSGVVQLLVIIADWIKDSENVEYELSKDFVPSTMTAQDLTALVSAWQQGAIGFTDLIKALQKGEIVDPERTPEKIAEEAAIEKEKANDLLVKSMDKLNNGQENNIQ